MATTDEDHRHVTRLRAHLADRRCDILDRYCDALVRADNALATRPRSEIEYAAGLLLDQAFGSGRERPDVAELIGEQRAGQSIPPEASMQAANLLLEVVSDEIACAPTHPTRAAALGVLGDLHRAILKRVVGAALPYASGLLRRIGDAHHQERRRIARDLHDRVAHSIGVCLQQLQIREVAERSGDDAEAARRLEILRDSLVDASDQIREIALQIGRFQTGDGFVQAIGEFVDLYGSERVTVHVTNGEELDSAPSWILEEFFYAVREGITNALQHSGSPRVNVAIGVVGRQMRATIEDYGKGLDPADTQNASAGKGLVSLRERIDLLGGRAAITSSPGSGTVVDLRAPLAP